MVGSRIQKQEDNKNQLVNYFYFMIKEALEKLLKEKDKKKEVVYVVLSKEQEKLTKW